MLHTSSFWGHKDVRESLLAFVGEFCAEIIESLVDVFTGTRKIRDSFKYECTIIPKVNHDLPACSSILFTKLWHWLESVIYLS